MESWEKGRGWNLVKNDSYYGNKPTMDGGEVQIIADSQARYNAFRTAH